MKYVIVAVAAAALLSAPPGFAQSAVSSTASQATSSAVNTAKTASNSAAINGNPAVVTSSASAAAPASGSNSFTLGEARARLERGGFSDVSNLSEDGNGVWHGQARKGGQATAVWLDYKGNIGEGK